MRGFALLAAFALGGCASASVGAPIELRGAGGSAPSVSGAQWEGEGTPLAAYALTPEAAFAEGRPTAHITRPGETLYAIAARHQTPLRALIDANGLVAPFTLQPGRRLTLPPLHRHRVLEGETWEGLGRRYAVHARSLALFNRRDPRVAPAAGEVIVLPFTARAAAPAAATARPAARAPSAGPTAAAPPPARPQRASLPARGAFGWPVEGRVITAFGAQPGGRRSDGLEISARPGAPVTAAGDGVVVYAGDDLPGYGNLVLAQHPGGVVTAYGRLGQITAPVGTRVRKGDPIGVAGVARLHFQIRAGGAAIDPTSTLPPRA